MEIYVGNLSFDTREDEIRQKFEGFGKVDSVKIIIDPASGRSRGFAFVDMPNVNEGQAAIKSLSGQIMNKRPLTVNEAHSRKRW